MKLDPADIIELRPLIIEIVRAVLDEMRVTDAKLDGRLGYPEAEAAALLGVKPHVLRDCRLRGEIRARLVGKKIVYPVRELRAFINHVVE